MHAVIDRCVGSCNILMTYLMKYVYVWKEENVIQINSGITTNVDVSVTES